MFTKNCCWCFTLQFGSYLIGVFLIVINILEILHLVDVYGDHRPDLSDHINEMRKYAVLSAITMSAVLVLIGAAVLLAMWKDKYRMMKKIAIALVVAAILRKATSIVRVMHGHMYDSFAAVFFICLFYFYFALVLWSYSEEERLSREMTDDPLASIDGTVARFIPASKQDEILSVLQTKQP